MKLSIVILAVNIVLAFGASLPQTKDLPRFGLIEQRIYKGEKAKKGQFPYIVYLQINVNDTVNPRIFCGGSIIDNNWILTAAHCTHNAISIKIFYGTIKAEEGELSHEIGPDDIIQHDRYDDIILEHDVSLIRTPHVDFTEFIQKVELTDRDTNYEGSWSVASGWGDTSDEGVSAEYLKFTDLQIIQDELCWHAIARESDNVLCVSTSEGKTIGSGDSGGPLVSHDDSKLVGVSSFTLSKGRHNIAGFSSVRAHRDWITEHTGIE